MPIPPTGTSEWLEADGLGGYASGTVSTIPTRRYHGLRITATSPPGGRMVLVAGMEVWVEHAKGLEALSSSRYLPDVVHPDGHTRIEAFSRDPWPRWTFRLADGTAVVLEVLATPPAARTLLRWSRQGRATGPLSLRVRPLLAARDYHGLQQQSGAARLGTRTEGESVSWRLYDGVPEVACLSNGSWAEDPQWFRQFVYLEEAARGLDASEDLASPGVLTFDLAAGDAVCAFGSGPALADLGGAARIAGAIAAERGRRLKVADPLERAAGQYLVRRGIGHTIIAGYPWFADWGRDTFISMRGLTLATRRFDVARDILLEWTGVISEGMLPNRFPDAGGAPEYNSVDASLWFMVVVGELLAHPEAAKALSAHDRWRLETAVISILEGHARGTRFGIRCDADGLLAAGQPGVQLTWMDARVDGRVITPRIGKPVEVQALWINALAVGERISARWSPVLARARAAFEGRFWNDSAGCLYDVVDADHLPGACDGSMRPNQALAVGGLPLAVLGGDRARKVVDALEAQLWTPLGLRSLSPADPAYAPRYEGGPRERDAVYHQGTVWPWLAGPFVDAWVRVRGGGAVAQREARTRFLAPLLAHLEEAGLGHVSEIADAGAPHRPRGCPFQAWSLGELIRLDRQLAR
ncbi:MAG: glycogen debranching enzyme family protein [Planctomycetes bacterium]|nr:glycogen debranching enzyme family protein [Planctomycetota bacterium]